MSKQHNYDGFYGGWYSRPGGFGGGGVTPVASSVTLQMGGMLAYTDLEYPTHWSVAFAKGTVPAATTFYLRETPPGGSEASVVNTVKPLSYWQDGSIRWAHIYGNHKWSGGAACGYKLKWTSSLADPPTSPLVLSESSTGYNINTGATSFVLPKAYPGIIGQGITGGGPVITDSSGNIYRPSGANTITIEESGAARFSVRMEANYVANGLTSFAKYITRVTAYQNSAIVDFDHATIFTDDMRNHKIASMGVEFSGSTKQILTRFLAEKAPATTSGNHFWQWPPGLADTNTAADYEVTNTGLYLTAGDVNKHKYVNTTIYQCQWLRKGPYLDVNVPTGYQQSFGYFTTSNDENNVYSFPTGQLNPGNQETELSLGAAISGHAVGVANHYKFAVNLGTSGSALQTVYENKPIGMPSTTFLSNTRGIGRTYGFTNDIYAPIDRFCINAVYGLFSHYARYNEGHWATFGALHHEEQIISNKPQLHRNICNNHYNHGTAIWGIFAASADTGVLKWARANIDYVTSIGQLKIDTVVPGYYNLYKGGFRHAKQFTPWGIHPSNNGINPASEDLSRVSHSNDPGAQLYAWYLDADRWAYEGFTDWYSGVISDPSLTNYYFGSGGMMNLTGAGENFRNTSNTLYNIIVGYEHNPTPAVSGAIMDAVRLHCSSQFDSSTKLLFNSIWESKFNETFPGYTGIARFIPRIVTGTGLVGTSARCGEIKLYDSLTMAAAADYYDMSGDSSVLSKFSGVLSTYPQRIVSGTNTVWDNFGNYMGPVVRENNFILQWPRFRYALKQAGIPLVNVPEEGTWLGAVGRIDYVPDETGRGIQIYTIVDSTNNVFTPHRVGVNLGDLQPSTLLVIEPNGTKTQIVGYPGTIAYNNYVQPIRYRESSHLDAVGTGHAIPVNGLAKISIVGYEPIFYKNSLSGNALQLIQDYRFGGYAGDQTFYKTGVSSGIISPISGATITVLASSMGPSAPGSMTIGDTKQWLLPNQVYTGTITSPTIFAIYVTNNNGVSLQFAGNGTQRKLALYGNQASLDALQAGILESGCF